MLFVGLITSPVPVCQTEATSKHKWIYRYFLSLFTVTTRKKRLTKCLRPHNTTTTTTTNTQTSTPYKKKERKTPDAKEEHGHAKLVFLWQGKQFVENRRKVRKQAMARQKIKSECSDSLIPFPAEKVELLFSIIVTMQIYTNSLHFVRHFF